MKYQLIFFAFWMVSKCFGQTTVLQVEDSFNEPIPLVHVISQNQLIAVTNADGQAFIPASRKVVELSHIAYKNQTITISDSLTIIQLEDEIYELDVIVDQEKISHLIESVFEKTFIQTEFEDRNLIFRAFNSKNDSLYYFRERKYIKMKESNHIVSDSAIFVQRVADYDKVWKKVPLSVSISSIKGINEFAQQLLDPDSDFEVTYNHLGNEGNYGYFSFSSTAIKREGLIKYHLESFQLEELYVTLLRNKNSDVSNSLFMKIMGGFSIEDHKELYARCVYGYSDDARYIKTLEDYFVFTVKKKKKIADLTYQGMLINEEVAKGMRREDLTQYGGYFYSRMR